MEQFDEFVGDNYTDRDFVMADYDDHEEEMAALQKRMKELEEETATLREMQGKAAGAAKSDARSIFVGNVDYGCTPEEVQWHFESCGDVNRVTIRTDKLGQPKGFAYVEFSDQQGAENALALNESVLYGRQIKVMAKRTNVPGMKQFRGRRGGGGPRGGRGSFYYGYGRAAARYTPYY